MTLREQLKLLVCPAHGERCHAVGMRSNRRVTFNCGREYHADDREVRSRMLRLPALDTE